MSTRRMQPAGLLRSARETARLTQRQLAERAGTAQSVIARIELGMTSPTVATLTRLLAAAGFELRGELTLLTDRETHMLEDVSRILRLTPEDRLREVANLSRFETQARRA